MEFCPKCGSLLVPKRNAKAKGIVLRCPSCGYEKKAEKNIAERYQIKERIEHKPSELPVIITEETLATAPTEHVVCPKCGHNMAYVIEVPTIDEEQDTIVTFYRCKKCGYSWREV